MGSASWIVLSIEKYMEKFSLIETVQGVPKSVHLQEGKSLHKGTLFFGTPARLIGEI